MSGPIISEWCPLSLTNSALTWSLGIAPFRVSYSFGLIKISVRQNTFSPWSLIFSFTISTLDVRDIILIFSSISFISKVHLAWTIFMLHRLPQYIFWDFLYFYLAWGTDRVWNLKSDASRQLADGQSSLFLCCLAQALDYQLLIRPVKRLWAIVQEMWAAPCQVLWIPSCPKAYNVLKGHCLWRL